MIDRVKEVLRAKSRSVREFAELIGVKQVTLNQQLAGDRKLSLDIVQSILNSFEDISSEWLLRGEGDMIKPQHEQIVEPQPALISTVGDTPEASILYHIYNDTINRMKELVEENTKLKMQVTELSEGSEELAKTLKSFHDSNKELADENQQLRIEVMIKDSQLKEKEKSVLDYKELLKKAI
jgi:transcriptional regulator with XRE-family HTH domain